MIPSTMNGTRMNQFVAPDELHHLDLAPSGEHRHADRVEDEHQGGDEEHDGGREEPHADLVERLLDALDDVEGEDDLVDARACS